MKYYNIFKLFYNNYKGIIFVCLIFIIKMFIFGKLCPCNDDKLNKNKNINKNKNFCRRHEIYGVQSNHFYFFILLGILFPSYFIIILILGIAWELFEYYVDKNYSHLIIKYNLGCLGYPPANLNNHSYNFYVYRNIQKYINPIDNYFNIKPSQIHGWHASIAEIIPNILGFIVGYILNKLVIR